MSYPWAPRSIHNVYFAYPQYKGGYGPEIRKWYQNRWRKSTYNTLSYGYGYPYGGGYYGYW